ncbi:uncharacterized protein PV09_00430 [Verruconis gallopava]|uniref:Uncharacterized protein n=1 Tax=Verruconis gallopava TaxID=253628 RepID=A0A0D1Z9C1_9PEZI|nr:uncharacterized protein PV09_00430 [Verruconis gallopava]KIW09557.1 hypothetical protein PV09_00430 [Verruconis gallopava]
MSSLVKKGFQLGKAVYATVNEELNKQSHKPHQSHQGNYAPTQIPGTYTAQGQGPPLPPRPVSSTPSPHSYGAPQGYGPPPGYGPPSGALQSAHTPPANSPYTHPSHPPHAQSPHNQPSHIPTQPPVHNHSAYTSPYSTHQPPTPGTGQPHVQMAPQTTGTILSGSSATGTPTQWTPASPPPTAVSPLVPHNPYSPPPHSNAPTQPVASPHTAPPVSSAHVYPLQHGPHAPSPPLSPPPPVVSPPLTSPYGPQNTAPLSPAMSPSSLHNSNYPAHHPNIHAPSASSGFPPQPGPMNQPLPAPHVQTPTSPVSTVPSQIPHPPAFVSELPAFTEPRPPPSTYSMPEGVAELPAELPAEPDTTSASAAAPAQTLTHPSPTATPPAIPASAITQSNSVEQPKPVHPPIQHLEHFPQNQAHNPQDISSSSAPDSQTPPTGSYQPYHPPHAALNPEHAPTPPYNSQAGYVPYSPSPSQYGPQPPAQTYLNSSAQHPGVPQKMGSLAQKIQQMNISNPQ